MSGSTRPHPQVQRRAPAAPPRTDCQTQIASVTSAHARAARPAPAPPRLRGSRCRAAPRARVSGGRSTDAAAGRTISDRAARRSPRSRRRAAAPPRRRPARAARPAAAPVTLRGRARPAPRARTGPRRRAPTAASARPRWPRRRARARPSIVVSSTGRISASTSSRIAHSRDHLAVAEQVGATAPGLGAGVQRADRLQHGPPDRVQPRLRDAGSPRSRHRARRTATAAPPAARRRRTAPARSASAGTPGARTVRAAGRSGRQVRPAPRAPRRPCCAASAARPRRHPTTGTTIGWRTRALARSPSTITASIGPSEQRRASWRRPGRAVRAARRGEHDRAVQRLARRARARARAAPPCPTGPPPRATRSASRCATTTMLAARGLPGPRRRSPSRACASRRPSAR